MVGIDEVTAIPTVISFNKCFDVLKCTTLSFPRNQRADCYHQQRHYYHHSPHNNMLPRTFFIVLICLSHLHLCLALTPSNKNGSNKVKSNPPKAKEPLKRSSSLDDSFFGKIDDHEPIKSDFFKPLDEDLLETKSKSPLPNVSKDSHPKDSNSQSPKKSEGFFHEPPLDSTSKFSCTKRALLLYKLTIQTIYQRLVTISFETF